MSSHDPVRGAADALADAADAVAEAADAVTEAADELVDRLADASVSGHVSRFDHAGATLIVEEHGQGAPLFVLIHGIGMGRKVFADLVTRLDGHGRVWTMDLPGYGEAPEPPRTPSMERQLARMARDLPRENLRVFLLGGREYLRAGPHLRRKLRAMLVHRPEDAYPRVSAPTLVLRGARDPVSPRAWSAQVAELLPDGRLAELDGHGHETLIRDAGPAATEILNFLASLDEDAAR